MPVVDNLLGRTEFGGAETQEEEDRRRDDELREQQRRARESGEALGAVQAAQARVEPLQPRFDESSNFQGPEPERRQGIVDALLSKSALIPTMPKGPGGLPPPQVPTMPTGPGGLIPPDVLPGGPTMPKGPGGLIPPSGGLTPGGMRLPPVGISGAAAQGVPPAGGVPRIVSNLLGRTGPQVPDLDKPRF